MARRLDCEYIYSAQFPLNETMKTLQMSSMIPVLPQSVHNNISFIVRE